ncbi:MAG: hypothetical protein COV55_04075 [Candidatus Komeilibacteria bacterium CG11_big_fil_rev_8_21_14_0_20_36_20]|uniref:DUF1648 domain-containing protein n=1 Tax=Candidatus Komeilibacteria bacterium CG11_big_fil_rev_8_21_14_0_20_36_20 TaxID=1974477 RepID=A0A2H0NE42_9BACT|nr:MAG: hypothetical protein COV55_04075 [Candidatus Komeilibacteria bacterium CG11_big_fil_rev_8_21_14_0_20_36_20]PIR82009.1 MAG: hypothetical protein COU21_00710 [Candidatus Komeilibacteria bacterium CG10_big_fil_rev_8_21_14_0_10_36_65]PJC55547.1 MAG: hypothetical protein CO027_01715 [Candidatus Komeilibacteria bacterium CG_4_9_14_0_2_um_filter_36_13]
MQIFKTVKIFYKDRLAFWLVNFSVLFILATGSLFLFKKIIQSPLAVLHYNIYAGIDMIGQWQWLYLIPGIVLVVSILNFILATWLWTKQRIWSYFLLTTILLINLSIFIFLYNILDYNSFNYNL